MNFQDVITTIVTMISCANEAEMTTLGARIGAQLRSGDTVALIGALGAGKTTLIRGLIQSVLPNEDVPSPTYTLVQTYDLPNYELWHCDLYRLKHPDEVFELGLIDAMDDAVCIIEWPDKMGMHLPKTALTINVTFADRGRQIIFGPEWAGRHV